MEQDRSLIPDSTGHCASNQDHEAGGEGGQYKRRLVVIPISTIYIELDKNHNHYDYNIKELYEI